MASACISSRFGRVLTGIDPAPATAATMCFAGREVKMHIPVTCWLSSACTW
jgi:hypothetical protein